ncbi:hypothetical protein F2Q69_00038555 [Brassica cretica]|uniref:GBF-interacting protein 1 N-terminal domain-containing protein n=1 Tax=Brassica cretica TaxID=69181 RepID=A0A8S9SEG3_BRACR|nr:hypothetical protein F2Q69_00038555 [Brassica cretica]
MTTSNGGDVESRVSIPADLRETFQNIREYTGKQHSDEDIFSVFKDCLNDPHETAQKLLFLVRQGFWCYVWEDDDLMRLCQGYSFYENYVWFDTFHEVKGKRERKKESLVPKTEEKGRNGRRNFASNYTGANNGRSGAFTRQSGTNHRIRRPIKASKPLIPPSGVSNPKITEEYPPSKSASSSEDVTELKKSKASETVPVLESVVQNGTQYAVDGTSTSSQQSATSNCGSQSDQVIRSEAAARKGNSQSLLKSDVGERPHVTFPVHLQVAKMLENGLMFGSFDSNFVKETFCDNGSIGCEDPTIKSSHGTASSEASAREDVSSVPQDKDHEISNVAPETELQLVEGSEVDKLNEESLPIKDTHQAANCDSPPISYPDQCSLAASQQAMHLLRQQYPLNFCPYGLYYPQPFYMPQPYIHQFLTPNAFQQQSYLPPQDDAPAPPGDELLLPQIKSGANIGNSPPTTFPSPYDSYAGAFNHIPSPVNEEQKEDSYTTGPVSLANLQASAMYNLSLQGQPLVFPTLQAGFTGIYQQAQPIPPPPAIPSMAEQPIGLPLITNQQPQAAPTNMDNY